MKNLIYFIALINLFGVSIVQAQAVEDIIAKHNEIIGGTASWKKISSMKMTGTCNDDGLDIDVTYRIMRGKGTRIDMKVMGMENYFIVTPKEGWIFIQGEMAKPKSMKPDEIRASQDQLEIADEFIDYIERGSRVELVGKEKLNGTTCFKIKVTQRNGDLIINYVDVQTYYITRRVATKLIDGKEHEDVRDFDNYKRLPQGITVPMTINSELGELAVDSVELNTINSDSIFNPSSK